MLCGNQCTRLLCGNQCTRGRKLRLASLPRSIFSLRKMNTPPGSWPSMALQSIELSLCHLKLLRSKGQAWGRGQEQGLGVGVREAFTGEAAWPDVWCMSFEEEECAKGSPKFSESLINILQHGLPESGCYSGSGFWALCTACPQLRVNKYF